MTNAAQWLRANAKRLTGYAGVQLGLQALNALSGLLLVRFLAKEDYAWFTLVSAQLGAISILADSGLGSATTALGGPVQGEPARFGSLLRAIRRLRYAFATIAALVVVPIGAYTLSRNRAPTTTVLVLSGLVVVTSFPATESVVWQTANRLRSRLRAMLTSDLSAGVARFVLVIAAALLGAGAMGASAATAAAAWIALLVLRRQHADLSRPESTSDATASLRPRILVLVRQYLPLTIFACVQGNLTTWLLGLLSTSGRVADVGAISRVSFVFGLMALPIAHFVTPAIARTTDRVRLKTLCSLALIGSATAALMVSGLGILFSEYVLRLLGPNYTHLDRELAWYLLASAVGLTTSTAWGIVLAKGWLKHSWAHIPLTLALQAVAAMFIPLDRIEGAIAFQTISSLSGLVVCAVAIVTALFRPSAEEAQACPSSEDDTEHVRGEPDTPRATAADDIVRQPSDGGSSRTREGSQP